MRGKVYRDAELSRMAFQKYGERLGDVPEELRSAEVCVLAVQNTAQNMSLTFGAVPRPLRTPEFCMTVIENANDDNMFNSKGESYRQSVFGDIPLSSRTPELCLAAARKAAGDDAAYVLKKTRNLS
jgi:hypothetical protein